MAIYESRKKELAAMYGTNGCITMDSWLKATFSDANGGELLYTDDLAFMYRDGTDYCVPEETETPTKLIVREYNGIRADIMMNGEVIGKTNTFLEIEPGDYEMVVSADGYVTQNIAVIVTKGKTNEYKYVTLVKTTTPEDETEETDTEYETEQPLGAILSVTGNTKMPTTIMEGEYNWFGWEVKNTGDADWKGVVGVKLVGNDETEFKWAGDTTKKQTVKSGETKYLWAYTKVTEKPGTGDIKIYALLTKTS